MREREEEEEEEEEEEVVMVVATEKEGITCIIYVCEQDRRIREVAN